MADGPARRRGPRPIGELVAPELSAACRKRGLADATLVLAWRDVVPRDLAEGTRLERIDWPRRDGSAEAGACLVVAATPDAALRLAHGGEALIDRINAVFGWRAVVRLKLVQRRSLAPGTAAGRHRPGPGDYAAARAVAGAVPHEKLSEALVRLGAHVYARSGKGGGKAP